MALTVEELQIKLGIDATQAEAALDRINAEIEKTAKKMATQRGGRSFLDTVSDSADKAKRKLSDVFKGSEHKVRDIFMFPRDFIRGFSDQMKEMRGKVDESIPGGKQRASEAYQAEKRAEAIRKAGEEAEKAAAKVNKYNREVRRTTKSGGAFSRIFGRIGKSFRSHNGILSRFGQTLKRIIMRMMAMALVRGVINSVTKGIQLLSKASSEAERQFGKFTALGNAVKASFGSVALSVLNAIAPALYNIASAAITAANAISRFFAALGGGSYMAVSLAGSFDDLADSASGAGGAAKGALAAFDELNVIGNQGGGGGGGVSSAFTTTPEKAESILANLLNEGLFAQAGDYVAGLLDNIVLSIDGFFVDLEEGNYGGKFASFLNGAFGNKKLFDDIGTTAANGANAIITNVKNFFETFDAKEAANAFKTSLETAIKKIKWEDVGETAAEGLLDLIDFVEEFLHDFDWGTVVGGVVDIVFGFVERLLNNPYRLLRALSGLLDSLYPLAQMTLRNWISSKFGPLGVELWDATVGKVQEMMPDYLGNMRTFFDAYATLLDKAGTEAERSAILATDSLGLMGEYFAEMGDKAGSATDAIEWLQKKINALTGKTISIDINYNEHFAPTSSAGRSPLGVNNRVITPFASGGIVRGDTIARVAEYSNAKSNPEVIAPLSELTRILQTVGVWKSNDQTMREQNALLREQNGLLSAILRKDNSIGASPMFGQVAAQSAAMYART